QSAAGSDDEGLDHLAQNWVGDTDHGSILNASQCIKDVLNFAWGDLFAAALDDVIFAADKVEIAFFVHPEEVAAITEPLVRPRTGTEALVGKLGRHPVAPHDVAPANDQFAHFARRESAAVFVFDPKFSPRNRDTRGGGTDVSLVGR